MAKVVECSIIIKDDFNNVFIVQRKTKKNEPKLWYSVGKKVRGKESEEKCISRAVKEDLKSIIFNLERIGEVLNKERDEICAVYKGELKERVTYGNDIFDGKWLSAKEIDECDLAQGEKEKILMYINR
ncbi:NUDIX domain-containing protein [Clostridium tertium]|uniref:NUDIX domain-containing protein n=1 Tax=Clostridium tertium TaxID=1559 RepID=UPI001AE7E522|nr:NUDIX domain-containing protein [Clostridium tertium]MBP1866634.1 hypothetical protein [Clostridium tertium]